jgi:hypothetical protein
LWKRKKSLTRQHFRTDLLARARRGDDLNELGDDNDPGSGVGGPSALNKAIKSQEEQKEMKAIDEEFDAEI